MALQGLAWLSWWFLFQLANMDVGERDGSFRESVCLDVVHGRLVVTCLLCGSQGLQFRRGLSNERAKFISMATLGLHS